MMELGWSISPLAVADYYGEFLTGFVLDERDATAVSVDDFACRVLIADTLMKTEHDKIRLAQTVLGWAEEFAS